MGKHFPHLNDIANEIARLDEDANVELLLGTPEMLKVREFRKGPTEALWIGPEVCYSVGHFLVRHVSNVQAIPCTSLHVVQR